MKIVCDSCATKYSISDDKVRGKVFKIRCKKCSHIIVVRGTTDAAAAPVMAAPASEGGWHLVVDGEQVGPLPETEIRARIERGEINGETYIWKEGMADWLKLATVPDFSDSVPAPVAGEVGEAGGVASDLFNDSLPIAARDASQVHVDDGMVQASLAAPAAHGGGLFGAIDAANNAVVSSARVGRASAADHGGDLFASHAVSQNGSEDGRRPAAAHDGGRVENLTAQRHENSVLFSLANLQQLAMPTVAPRASALPTNGSSNQSEGSGLIDIRAMAASTMGSPSESRSGGGGMGEDLPTFGSFSAAAPVLLPMPSQSGPPKWIYAVIGAMVLLVFGIGLMAYKILTTKPVTVEVPIAAPPLAPVAIAPRPVAPAVPGTPVAPAIPDDKLPPREGDAPKAAVAEAGLKHERAAGGKKFGKAGGKDRDKKGGASEPGGKSAAAVAAPAPEPEKKAKPGSLDDLLEGALSGKQKTRSRASSDDDAPKRSSPSASAEPAGPLSKTAVVSGMNSIKPKINECYAQFKVAGMAMVNVVIAKSGKVTGATVSGKFTGTPTGACVEKAVKSASFPPSEGLTTPYPFQLK